MRTKQNGQIVLTFREAAARLVDGDEVHCFLNPRTDVLVGADWARADVLDALRLAPEIHCTGSMAQRMNHGIACQLTGGEMAFFATKPQEAPDA